MAPALEEAIPVANPNKSAPNFAAAFMRLDRTVAWLGRAKGVSVVCAIAVEPPLFDDDPITYRINLSGGIAPASLQFDHQVFTASDEYFAAFAVPQLEAAIGALRDM
jgi:hypothetical protein